MRPLKFPSVVIFRLGPHTTSFETRANVDFIILGRIQLDRVMRAIFYQKTYFSLQLDLKTMLPKASRNIPDLLLGIQE